MLWMILAHLLLVANKNKRIKAFLLIAIICWGVAVSLSWVLVGAHHASDVLFGSVMIIVAFLFITKSYWE